MELYKNYNEKTIKLIKELGFYGKTPKEIELLIVLELEKCKKNSTYEEIKTIAEVRGRLLGHIKTMK